MNGFGDDIYIEIDEKAFTESPLFPIIDQGTFSEVEKTITTNLIKNPDSASYFLICMFLDMLDEFNRNIVDNIGDICYQTGLVEKQIFDYLIGLQHVPSFIILISSFEACKTYDEFVSQNIPPEIDDWIKAYNDYNLRHLFPVHEKIVKDSWCTLLFPIKVYNHFLENPFQDNPFFKVGIIASKKLYTQASLEILKIRRKNRDDLHSHQQV